MAEPSIHRPQSISSIHQGDQQRGNEANGTAASETDGCARTESFNPAQALLTSTTGAKEISADLIAGYHLEQELGRGGMGIVYRARQLSAGGRQVALKVIKSHETAVDGQDWQAACQRFRREIAATARLEHDHIVRVFEAGESRGCLYYSMQLVGGPSLELCIRRGTTGPELAATYVEQAARGLAYAHAHGVIHRDISPHNILIDDNGRALLADFGLAKLSVDEATATQSGAVLGKRAFMPVEQFQDSAGVDERADIYSLGATLYAALTGAPPHGAGTLEELYIRVRDQDPVPPRRVNPNVPRDLQTICLKCLRAPRSERYQTALELAEDLRRFRTGETILARPASLIERSWSWTRRNRRLAITGAMAFSLLVLLFVGGAVSHAWLKELEAKKERERFEKLIVQARDSGHRGQWASAADILAQLTPYDDDSALRLRLERAQAHLARADLEAYQATVTELAARETSGPFAAEIALHQANVLRLQGNPAAAEEKVRLALQLGLDEAMAPYARSLLAETTPEALAELEKAVAANPFNQDALLDLIGLQLLFGKYRNARPRLDAALLLFPEDPRFRILSALELTLLDQREAARRETHLLSNRLPAAQLQALSEALDVLGNIAGQFENGVKPLSFDDLVLLGKAAGIFGRLAAISNSPEHEMTASSVMLSGASFPPVLRKVYGPWKAAFVRMFNPVDRATDNLLNADRRLLADLERAVAVHPEAGLLYLECLIHHNAQRFAEITPIAERCANSPSMFPGMRVRARLLAALSIVQSEQHDLSEATARLATEQVRQALGEGELRFAEWDFAIPVAIKAKEIDFASEVMARWRKVAPTTEHLPILQAEIEMAAGRPGSALDHIKPYLAKHPDNERARKVRDAALQATSAE